MVYTDGQLRFLTDHVWAVLATSRRDGSPQQSMVGYTVDEEGRVIVSTQAFTAKWHNAVRRPSVCITVPDSRVHSVSLRAAILRTRAALFRTRHRIDTGAEAHTQQPPAPQVGPWARTRRGGSFTASYIGPLTGARYRVVVPDHLGFGRSDKPRLELP